MFLSAFPPQSVYISISLNDDKNKMAFNHFSTLVTGARTKCFTYVMHNYYKIYTILFDPVTRHNENLSTVHSQGK